MSFLGSNIKDLMVGWSLTYFAYFLTKSSNIDRADFNSVLESHDHEQYKIDGDVREQISKRTTIEEEDD